MATITGTFNSLIAGTISGSVATPGATGPAGPTGATGPAGPGVPAGGTAGQYLQKIDGVDYNTDWVTINLSAYAPLNSPVFTGDPQAPTPTFGDNDTSIATTAFVQAGLLGGTANARNLEVYVRNQSGSTIPAGSIVYISGATGNRPLITLAQANNDANSAQTMGFTKTSIANNGTGYVIVRGELENIDTSALTEGVQLYLSPTTAGTWTTTKPSAPQHLVYVGIVVRAHPTQGVILVAVQNGYELNELHDVSITSPTNGQVLKYNSTTNLWVNGTDSSGVAWGGITGTLSSQTDLQSALDGKYSTSNPAGYITSSALSPYLTSATAASTYQTISGMSSYLTTSAAASTYLTQSNAASTYQTQAGMTNYLSKAGNLSGLASTSTARTNLGLGTLSTVNDAPANGSQYARKNNAWEVVSGGGGATWGSITGTLSSQTDLNSALAAKASLSGATFSGTVSAPTPSGIANDTVVINRSFSEFNLGLNWADLVSTRVHNVIFSCTGSDPESPVEYEQTVYFDFCCPEGFNNLYNVNSASPSINFQIYLAGVQQTAWTVSSSAIASTGNSRVVTTSFPYGNNYDVYVEVGTGAGVFQISRFKIGTFST